MELCVTDDQGTLHLSNGSFSHTLRQATPQSTVKAAADLLSQQIWCFGRDIEPPEGNLLVRFGFDRIPPPASISSASTYRMAISTTANILLRGFGVFYGDQRWGGLFLHRYSFLPKFTRIASLAKSPWQPSDLPLLWPYCERQFPQGRALLIELIDWLRGYEAWIACELGVAYRRASLARWIDGRRKVVAAEDMAAGWRQIGMLIANHADWFLPTIGERRDVSEVPSAVRKKNLSR